MTICPCCGVKAAEVFSNGCASCGAQSVGEPLPQPEHQLPSYLRALVLVGGGIFSLLVFIVQAIIAAAHRTVAPSRLWSIGFWSWEKAAETAAWRLKWFAIPLTLGVLIIGRRIFRSILSEPLRFCGARYARNGFNAAALVCAAIILLIAVSIPKRLEYRQLAIEAAYNAQVQRISRGLFEYSIRYGTLPSEPDDLLRSLPDPDGSLAAALRDVGPLGPGVYKPSGADLAALPKQKSRTLKGAVLRNASVDVITDDALPTGFSFTDYELRLPGPDKVSGTDDDVVVYNGLIKKASETAPGALGSTASSGAIKH